VHLEHLDERHANEEVRGVACPQYQGKERADGDNRPARERHEPMSTKALRVRNWCVCVHVSECVGVHEYVLVCGCLSVWLFACVCLCQCMSVYVCVRFSVSVCVRVGLRTSVSA
jgi:hypothetical protein